MNSESLPTFDYRVNPSYTKGFNCIHLGPKNYSCKIRRHGAHSLQPCTVCNERHRGGSLILRRGL